MTEYLVFLAITLTLFADRVGLIPNPWPEVKSIALRIVSRDNGISPRYPREGKLKCSTKRKSLE
jgi:hypothetical protein